MTTQKFTILTALLALFWLFASFSIYCVDHKAFIAVLMVSPLFVYVSGKAVSLLILLEE